MKQQNRKILRRIDGFGRAALNGKSASSERHHAEVRSGQVNPDSTANFKSKTALFNQNIVRIQFSERSFTDEITR